jgi:hypothetical protein
MQSRGLLHLLEPLDRDHRRQGFSFAFDHELIMPERHPIEKIPESLTHLQCGYRFNHGSPHLYQVV